MLSPSPSATRSSISDPAEEAGFFRSLAEALHALSGSLDPSEVLERACLEAARLFEAETAYVFQPDEPPPPVEAAGAESGRLVLPLAARGEPIGSLVLERPRPFGPADLARGLVLADFVVYAFEGVRLLREMEEREVERSRLAEQLITAEQDERRRLALFLHDGPLQSLAGIALMHDAALAALREGRHDEAETVIASALERERQTIQTLRDLSFAIEPVVLRDHGFVAAVRELADQIERPGEITVTLDVGAGERLSEKAQVALYQTVREALNQAVRRGPSRISAAVTEGADGGLVAAIADDGVGERRRASLEAIRERARILNGKVAVDPGSDGGTVARIALPAYLTAPRK